MCVSFLQERAEVCARHWSYTRIEAAPKPLPKAQRKRSEPASNPQQRASSCTASCRQSGTTGDNDGQSGQRPGLVKREIADFTARRVVRLPPFAGRLL